MPFNDFFQRLLGLTGKAPTCSQLSRSGKYAADYAVWVEAQEYLQWTGPLFKAYHYQKASLPAPQRVQLIQQENLRGAVFFYDPSIGADNFSFLFDLLKDRVLQCGYTLHSCDKLEVRHERYTEQVEKHLLTPPASDIPGTSVCNQLYGNVLIDYIKVNKHPGYIRFVANSYNDAYFSTPLPFEELLEKVLQPWEQWHNRNSHQSKK
ncbi:hypothetical protein [Pontibacter akesuensis]|uniref:Uncharacterized protein n=1 Tax=Pontibacter akesuensis TaxID=388950 RepID=A0A1I7FT78_9BACT|nr:hypothetical protein [Pontibacter akesuensis]GHA60599.1 hypothetical protein GCM10007389_11090 [Pontibacter akesuensis]SFU39434.1 hypothetical protein SAMN04487941_0452 [Pontibacter akesuensis]